MNAGPLIADVQRAVADHFGLRLSDMVGAARHRAVARPRQIGMYLAREHSARSFSMIGRRFGGRDHSTVMHGVRQIRRLRVEDPEVGHAVTVITDGLFERFCRRAPIAMLEALWP